MSGEIRNNNNNNNNIETTTYRDIRRRENERDSGDVAEQSDDESGFGGLAYFLESFKGAFSVAPDGCGGDGARVYSRG